MLARVLDALRKLRKKPQTLIEVRVIKDHLIHNLNELRKHNHNFSIAPVLKSNAYGHGIVEVAKILDKQKCPFFCVDSYYEARLLKRRGIRTQILIMGYTPPEVIIKNTLDNVAFTLISLEQLKAMAGKIWQDTAIHLKFDTGMKRQGMSPNDAAEVQKILTSNEHFLLEGLMSHLADAEGWFDGNTQKQLDAWSGVIKSFRDHLQLIKYYHIRSTKGKRFNSDIQSNVIRVGLALYGIDNDRTDTITSLKPVLELVSHINQLKVLNPGDKVGYNFSYEASRKTLMAVVPIGYYEGVDKRLSNKGFFKVKNTMCPIIGKVCMNITMIDVSHVPDVQVGDEVVIVSRRPSDKNSLRNISVLTGIDPHELLVHIPAFLRRRVI